MISPEVFNFAPPNHLVQTYELKDEQILKKLPPQTEGNHFHGLTAVFPCKTSNEIQHCLSDSVYYEVKNLPVSRLLENDFLSTFIRKGHLEARTIGTWREVDQFVSLDSGVLTLSVDKDTYQELGLDGQPEIVLTRKNVAKYCITINLLEDKFQESNKYYKRVTWCLKKCVDLQFDWIIMWEPHDPSVCPSSLAAFLDLNNFKVTECKPLLETKVMNNPHVPILSPDTAIEDMIEWIGAAVLDIECPLQEQYASSFCCPEPNCVVEEVNILAWRGFYSSRQAKKLLSTILDSYQDIAVENIPPWVNLTFHSFDEVCSGNSICSVMITSSTQCQVFTSHSRKKFLK